MRGQSIALDPHLHTYYGGNDLNTNFSYSFSLKEERGKNESMLQGFICLL